MFRLQAWVALFLSKKAQKADVAAQIQDQPPVLGLRRTQEKKGAHLSTQPLFQLLWMQQVAESKAAV